MLLLRAHSAPLVSHLMLSGFVDQGVERARRAYVGEAAGSSTAASDLQMQAGALMLALVQHTEDLLKAGQAALAAEQQYGGGAAAAALAAANQAVQALLPADRPPTDKFKAEEAQQLVRAACQLAAALEQHWQQHAWQQDAFALAQARAARSCAYLRCANAAQEGGPAAGQGAGSGKCSVCRTLW